MDAELKEVTVEFNTDTGYVEVYIPKTPLHRIPAPLWTDYNNAWRSVQDLSDAIEAHLKDTGQAMLVNDPDEWATPWPLY